MKVNVLAFAPLGLAAFLATVSAGPTVPTNDADTNDELTEMTVSAAFMMVTVNYLRVKATLSDTIRDEYSGVEVKDLIGKITKINEEFEAKESQSAKTLDENNPEDNGTSFSELQEHCSSRARNNVKEVCDTLGTSFNESTIPVNLLEKSLDWAFARSLTKILIEDHSTITSYFMSRFPELVSINEKSFKERISVDGAVNSMIFIELYFGLLDENKDGKLDDEDLPALRKKLQSFENEDISNSYSFIHMDRGSLGTWIFGELCSKAQLVLGILYPDTDEQPVQVEADLMAKARSILDGGVPPSQSHLLKCKVGA
ncbi:hypothetical protein IWQ61_009197 [Dispira simplex]|nr:hypothetical protein IWQ61_009197 [Dispira simplex]